LALAPIGRAEKRAFGIAFSDPRRSSSDLRGSLACSAFFLNRSRAASTGLHTKLTHYRRYRRVT
jgi:hypothetical protein